MKKHFLTPRYTITDTRYEIRSWGSMDSVFLFGLVLHLGLYVFPYIASPQLWGIGWRIPLMVWAGLIAFSLPPQFWAMRFSMENGRVEAARYYMGIRYRRKLIVFDRVESLCKYNSLQFYREGRLVGELEHEDYIEDHTEIVLRSYGQKLRTKVKLDWYGESHRLISEFTEFLKGKAGATVWGTGKL